MAIPPERRERVLSRMYDIHTVHADVVLITLASCCVA